MRIAQITDLHMRHHVFGTSAIPTRRSREMPQLFQSALDQIRQSDIDVIALTGDLLDAPTWLERPTLGFSHDDLEPWHHAAIADYAMLRDMLDEAAIPYIVLPGNHDSQQLMWQVFDAEENVREIAGYRFVRFNDSEHNGNIPRRFIPDRLRFDQEVDRENSLPQVHLQHYLIAPRLETGYPFNYLERDYLERRMAASPNVRLSLSGHYHKGIEPLRVGETTFATGPAFGERPFRWRVYEVEGDSIQCIEKQMGDDALPARQVVFLDRDGVINDRASYTAGPEAMHLIPGSAAAIRRLNDAGKAVVVVTSQNGVGGGTVPAEVVHAVNDRMYRLLFEEAGATIDAMYASFDAGPNAALPEYATLKRAKPNPTMLLEARDVVKLNFDDAWMVGDNITDAHAAAAAGVEPILVLTGHGPTMQADFEKRYPQSPIVNDLEAAVGVILKA